MIHRFLLWVAAPAMQCPVNPEKSLMEIIRVAKHEAAIMAIVGNQLVGTLGIIKATWWYGDADFLTDRWHFVLPEYRGSEVDKTLMGEAMRIADETGLKFVDQGKVRERQGKILMMPRVYTPESSTVQPAGTD